MGEFIVIKSWLILTPFVPGIALVLTYPLGFISDIFTLEDGGTNSLKNPSGGHQ